MNLGKVTWRMMEISTILLYIVVIGYGYILGIAWLGWTIFLSLMLLHLGEMKTAMTEGHKKGLSNRNIILMNMLFGFTWWVPLRRGIFNK